MFMTSNLVLFLEKCLIFHVLRGAKITMSFFPPLELDLSLTCLRQKYPRGLRRDIGSGRVHHYLMLKLLGRKYSQDSVCCRGFAILKRDLVFSSMWLNARDQVQYGVGKPDNSNFLCP